MSNFIRVHKIFSAVLGMLIVLLVGVAVIFYFVKDTSSIEGKWYAVNSANEKITITFNEKTLKFHAKTRTDLDDLTMKYQQQGAGFRNKASYRQIKIGKHRYTVAFSNKRDKSQGYIILPGKDNKPLNGTVIWSINRSHYPKYPAGRVDLN